MAGNAGINIIEEPTCIFFCIFLIVTNINWLINHLKFVRYTKIPDGKNRKIFKTRNLSKQLLSVTDETLM